jgi:hypothetical protein
MSYFTTSEINLYFMYNSAKRTLTLKDINDFIRFWHCVNQPYCILTLSNSWHERFCFVLYLWEGRNKRYKGTKNGKILMTTVPTGGLFEYTRLSIFVSTSVHVWHPLSSVYVNMSYFRVNLLHMYDSLACCLGERDYVIHQSIIEGLHEVS